MCSEDDYAPSVGAYHPVVDEYITTGHSTAGQAMVSKVEILNRRQQKKTFKSHQPAS